MHPPGRISLPVRWRPADSRWQWQSEASTAGIPHHTSERKGQRYHRSETSAAPEDPPPLHPEEQTDDKQKWFLSQRRKSQHLVHLKETWRTSVWRSLLSKVSKPWKLVIQVSMLSSKNSGRSWVERQRTVRNQHSAILFCSSRTAGAEVQAKTPRRPSLQPCIGDLVLWVMTIGEYWN